MRTKLDLKFWIGSGISLFFMVMLFRKMDFNQLWSALTHVDYRFIGLAVIFNFVSYFFRAFRWRYLLIQEKTISLSSLYPATIIGYMANNILPARLGEFVRAYVLAQRENLQIPVVFASLVIDRLCDGFTVMLLLVFTLVTLQLPQGMADAEQALRTGGKITFILYAVVLTFLVLLKRQTAKTLHLVAFMCKPFPAALANRVIPLLGSVIGGLRISAQPLHVFVIFCSSLVVWLFCLLPVDMVLQGFGIHLPITASMFILVLLVFAVMVPAAPGYIGVYHSACFLGLSAFGIAKSTALSIALVVHGVGFFPVIVAGFLHMWLGNISLKGISSQAEKGN